MTTGLTTPRQNAEFPIRRRRAAIRETRFDDYPQIAALHRRNGLASKPCAAWMDLWRNNPAYLRHDGRWIIGWVIEGEDGDIVGSIANVPMEYSFEGIPLRGAASCSWAVDPAYRAHSMRLLDGFTNQPGLDLLLSTTVSASVEQAFRMFHWAKIPAGAWDQSAFWVTNYAGFAERVLRMKSAPIPGLLSYPVSAALYCWDNLRRYPVSKAEAGIEVVGGFDSRFEDFWQQWKTENYNQLVAVRTLESLWWHFGGALARNDAWIVTASRGSRLGAYAIFDRHEDPVSGLKRVRLVDFVALREYDTAFPRILLGALQECREQGVHMLQTTGLWLRSSWMAGCPPTHYRTLPSWSFYYRAANPRLAGVLKNPEIWTPTSFDGDASL